MFLMFGRGFRQTPEKQGFSCSAPWLHPHDRRSTAADPIPFDSGRSGTQLVRGKIRHNLSPQLAVSRPVGDDDSVAGNDAIIGGRRDALGPAVPVHG
jgi:hypothetical protein